MSFNRQKIYSDKPKLKIVPTRTKRRKIKKTSNTKIKRINTPSIRKIRKKIPKVKKAQIKRKNCDRKIFKPLSRWTNSLKGQPIFILGNSPSIEKQSLELLDPYFTLGINRIFYLYQPTVLFWQDRQMWRRNKDEILTTEAIRVCRDIVDKNKLFLNYSLGLDPFKMIGKPHRLKGRGNTTAIAVQFAVSLGCSSIVLLGTDCKYNGKDKTDFYGKNPDHTDRTLDMCKEASKWVKKSCPVPIYNCSRNKQWPIVKLKDILKELGPKKFGRKYFKKLFSR